MRNNTNNDNKHDTNPAQAGVTEDVASNSIQQQKNDISRLNTDNSITHVGDAKYGSGLHFDNHQDRDEFIYDTLALRVRLVTLNQLTKYCFEGNINSAKRRIKAMKEAVRVERFRLLAHPILPLQAPVYSWPEQPFPRDFEKLSHQVRSRWSRQRTQQTVVVATKQLANLYGRDYHTGIGRVIEIDHDIHMAEVYFRFLLNPPAICKNRTWLGEDACSQDILSGQCGEYGESKFDALFIDSDYTVNGAIDFCGRYSATKLSKMIGHCRRKKYEFVQLW